MGHQVRIELQNGIHPPEVDAKLVGPTGLRDKDNGAPPLTLGTFYDAEFQHHLDPLLYDLPHLPGKGPGSLPGHLTMFGQDDMVGKGGLVGHLSEGLGERS